MDSAKWYYLKSGRQRGAMDAGDLQGLLQSGALPPARWFGPLPRKTGCPPTPAPSKPAAPPLEVVRLEKRAGSPCLASWP